MSVRAHLVLALLVGLAVGALAAPTARASSEQFAIFQDDRQLVHGSDAVRERTLDEIAGLGSDVLKLQLVWANIAPHGRRKPAHFDAANPSSYPAGAWARYDRVVEGAARRGLPVLLAPTGPAPAWATARRRVAGVDRPDPREFGAFVRAAGQRYPQVRFWTIWNEPNGIKFLAPQSDRRAPISPRLYRNLVYAALGALRSSGHGRDRILFGELLPIGQRTINGNQHPLAFIREFFCLDRRFRPYRGRIARARGCRAFRPIAGVSGFGYHPYIRPSGPDTREPSSDDATIRSLGRVAAALDRAAARGRLARKGLPIYNTEFGIQTNPPDPLQTPIRRAPALLNKSEWLSWRQRRVVSWSQYLMLDDPRRGSFESGLRFRNGAVKPGMHQAYRLPLYVHRLGRGAIEVWGCARPAGAGAQVEIQTRGRRGAFRALRSLTVRSPHGYFNVRVRMSAPERRSYRFVVRAGPAAGISRTAALDG